jgi:hypothetical protein
MVIVRQYVWSSPASLDFLTQNRSSREIRKLTALRTLHCAGLDPLFTGAIWERRAALWPGRVAALDIGDSVPLQLALVMWGIFFPTVISSTLHMWRHHIVARLYYEDIADRVYADLKRIVHSLDSHIRSAELFRTR